MQSVVIQSANIDLFGAVEYVVLGERTAKNVLFSRNHLESWVGVYVSDIPSNL